MNPLLEVICNEINKLKKALTTTGSDYTATVTKVEGDTAYVQIAGSDISDTPVALSINAKPGDQVRVRVVNGKAWIAGNDTAPPTDDAATMQEIRKTNELIDQRKEDEDGRYSAIEQSVDQITLEVGEKMDSDMGNRSSNISIDSGKIAFNSNSLVVNSSKFQLDENGNANFSGTLKGATYEDSSQRFKMDIGSAEYEYGAVTPAFRINGYVNGNPSNDYLEIEITLYQVSGESIPHLSIAGTVRDNPNAGEKGSASIGLDDSGVHFYGSWANGAQRVHSSLPWGYNP